MDDMILATDPNYEPAERRMIDDWMSQTEGVPGDTLTERLEWLLEAEVVEVAIHRDDDEPPADAE